MQIEIKIPNDPAVIAAVADWLSRLSGEARVGFRPEHGAPYGEAVPMPQLGDIYTAALQPAPEPLPVYTPPTAEEAFGSAAPQATPGIVTAPSPEPQVTSNVHPNLCGRGFPFDARIHAGSKQLLAKKPHGWKPLRGVDPALVAAVEAEYIAAGYGKPTAPYVPPAAPTPTPPPAPAPAAGFGAMPPGSAFDTGQGLTFAAVMARVGAANKLKEAQDLLPAFQLATLPQLGARPDLWESFLATLGA